MLIRVTRKPPVDWFRILAELRRAGMTQCTVAKALDLPRSTIRNWSYGQAPRYEDGRALLMLWRCACYRMSENGQRKRVQSGNGTDHAHN